MSSKQNEQIVFFLYIAIITDFRISTPQQFIFLAECLDIKQQMLANISMKIMCKPLNTQTICHNSSIR